jgi:uncharacterized surface anchored protein
VVVIGDGETVINYKGSVQFAKKDEHGNPIVGCTFELKNTDTGEVVEPENGDTDIDIPTPSGQDKYYFESNEKGIVKAINLSPAHYEFTEINVDNSPALVGSRNLGYITNTEPIKFEILGSAYGEPETLVLDDFINYKGTVQLLKHDKDGKVLAGAEFKLHEVLDHMPPPGFLEFGTYTTSANGTIDVADLSPGKYCFIETKYPEGYTGEKDMEYHFTVPDSVAGKPSVIKVDVVNEKVVPPKPTPPTPKPPTPTPPKPKPSPSPDTGDNANVWLYILLGVGSMVIVRKKKVSKSM